MAETRFLKLESEGEFYEINLKAISFIKKHGNKFLVLFYPGMTLEIDESAYDTLSKQLHPPRHL